MGKHTHTRAAYKAAVNRAWALYTSPLRWNRRMDRAFARLKRRVELLATDFGPKGKTSDQS